MVDMMYLVYVMTKREHDKAFTLMQAYLKKHFTRGQLRKDKYDKNAHITNAFSEFGFQEIRLRSASWGYYSIEVRLRPKLTIDKDGYYCITKISEFEGVRNVFNYILQDILSLKVPDFFDWTAKNSMINLKKDN